MSISGWGYITYIYSLLEFLLLLLRNWRTGLTHSQFYEILRHPWISSAMTMAMSIYGTLCVLVWKSLLFKTFLFREKMRTVKKKVKTGVGAGWRFALWSCVASVICRWQVWFAGEEDEGREVARCRRGTRGMSLFPDGEVWQRGEGGQAVKLTAASVEGDPKSPQLPVEGRANVGSDQPASDKHWNKSIELRWQKWT